MMRPTHVGGPTVLVELDGWRILTDPTFDPPGSRYRFGWRTSSTKTAGPAIAVEQVGAIDAVLLSHDHHADNLDDSGRTLLPDAEVVVTNHTGEQRLRGVNVLNVRGPPAWRLHAVDRPAQTAPDRHGRPMSPRTVPQPAHRRRRHRVRRLTS